MALDAVDGAKLADSASDGGPGGGLSTRSQAQHGLGSPAPEPCSEASMTARCPLQGPVCSHDVMCAKVLFALCGSVFPHPLLLAQQVLGIEDADFPEFQQNVAEAGNNCIDIVAAYLTNLRVVQEEEDPNPAVSPAMIQPRHAATVASVAAKARELLCELALARATVKPRKAPKNKAMESAARTAASSSGMSWPGGPASACSTGSSSVGTCSPTEGTCSSAEDASTMSETGCAAGDDAFGTEDSNDDDGSEGHLDTSRLGMEGPCTAREEEERLLCALQGPAAAEELLKLARARPAGCKSPPPPGADIRSSTTSCDGQTVISAPVPVSAPSPSPRASQQGNTAGLPGSARAAQASSQVQASAFAAASSGTNGANSSRRGHEGSGGARGEGAGGRHGNAGAHGLNREGVASMQSAYSCPITGLPEVASPLPSGHGSGNASGNHHAGGSKRGNSRRQQQQQQQQHGSRMSPGVPTVGAMQQQHQQQQLQQQQQQQLAMAQLLGLRTGNSPSLPYGNSSAAFNNLALAGLSGYNGLSPAALSAAAAASHAALAASTAQAALAAATSNRMDANAMATAALEQFAAQHAAALGSGNGMPGSMGGMGPMQMSHLGGFGGGNGAGSNSGYGGAQLGLGAGGGGLGGMGGPSAALLQQQQQQQQQQAAVAALLQQHHHQQGGMMLGAQDALKGGPMNGGSNDAWSNVLLQAQLAASLS